MHLFSRASRPPREYAIFEFWSNSDRGRLLDWERLLERRTYYDFSSVEGVFII